MAASATEPTLFCLLTGFLGAGKTTVLNRALAGAGGRRIAVLVNELGKISIDSQLIVKRGSDLLELAGGCVCCSVDLKNDLWDGIREVIRRSAPDHVILETTGIAEPQLLFARLRHEGFLAAGQQGHASLVRPSGVIAVVDAASGLAHLECYGEAREQVLSADRILVSKLDLASGHQVVALHERLAAMNPRAERAAFPPTSAGDRALVPWLLEPRPLVFAATGGKQAGAAPGRAAAAHSCHQLVAATFTGTEPLVREAVWRVLREHRDRLVRVKGWVRLAGESGRVFVELAGGELALRRGGPGEDAVPRSELVLIGEGLDEAALRRQLWACRAGPGTTTS